MKPANVVIVLLTLVFIGIVIMLLQPLSVSERSGELRVKYRLFRLGRAVNFWVEDHGRTQFPKITNPTPFTPWEPDRLGSAANVLADYLGGDVRPHQQEGETPEAYHARLRERELTVDPATGYEFWYNPLLPTADPQALAKADRPLMYFTCQKPKDGPWQYESDGETGTWRVSGNGEQRQVSEDELLEHQLELDRLEKEYATIPRTQWEVDLDDYRRQVLQLEKRFQTASEDDEGRRFITIIRLDCKVGFEAKD